MDRHAARVALVAALIGALALASAPPAPAAGAAPDAATAAGGGNLIETAMAREGRVALVIGNAHYASAPLANPVNDARSMAASLKTMGFRVILVEDASITKMAEAVTRFGDSLRPGGVGLFFYAGHGMQIKGRNFLIPVGADIQREDEVAFNAFDAGQVLEKMETAKSRINIVILDACRNNPFSRSFRSGSQGLATIDAPFGSYVAMATAPGRVASDGSDGNGLYTKNLLAAMRTPGIPIEDVFKRTRVAVMSATDSQQVPWDYSSLSGNFYFVPTETIAEDMMKTPTPSAPVRLASAPSSSSPAAPAKSAAAAPREGDAAPRSADTGQSAAAAYELGLQYKIGRRPMTQDLPRALKLFVEAAHRNHPGAQLEAAQAYAKGQGTAKSCKDAIGWAQKSARGGSIEGALLAGDLLRADCNGSRNLAEAARWYRVAADKGMAPAQFALGLLYLNGEGVSKDLSEARKWLTAAAGSGSTSARFYLERIPR